MVNPFAMRETTLIARPTERKKNIVVVGAGPAGLETAWLAAARGHSVAIYDKGEMPGGQFRAAAIPPHKQLLTRAIAYYRTMCEKYGVKLVFNTEVTKDMILNLKPDTVVLATGGTPLLPRIPGIDESDILTGQEVLLGADVGGKRVLVIGGGAQGAETADHLGQYGYEVTVVEMRDSIALDDPEAVRELLFERFAETGVVTMPGTTVKQIYKDGADCEKDGEAIKLRNYDRVVLALGVRAFNPLETELKDIVKELIVVGDAARASDAVEAIYKGALLGVSL